MHDPARLMRFILELRQTGLTDSRVLAAIERTPRGHYAPAGMDGLAFDDVNIPLPHGQSMSKPSLIGRMLMALKAQERDSVLEIGTGSGYQAAVLSHLAHRVVTLERLRDLCAEARGKIGAARLMRVFAHVADGAEGWADDAPFDRIIVNAAVEDIPPALLQQLKPDGVLVAPVGERLIRFSNGQRDDLGPIKLAPLERGVAE